MLFNFILLSETFIKSMTGRILPHIEQLVRLCRNFKTKEKKHKLSWRCSLRSLSHVTSPSLPLSYFLLLSLWYGCAKNIPSKHPLHWTLLWRLSHDSSDMYVHDAAAWKDRLLLTFASAVGCYCHSNTVMLTLLGTGCVDGRDMSGGMEGGRWIINHRTPHSVAGLASDGEVNGVGRRLFSSVKGSCCVAVTLGFVSLSFFLLVL